MRTDTTASASAAAAASVNVGKVLEDKHQNSASNLRRRLNLEDVRGSSRLVLTTAPLLNPTLPIPATEDPEIILLDDESFSEDHSELEVNENEDIDSALQPFNSNNDIDGAEPNFDAPTIFIGIASFRDELCHKTIISAFETAAFPDSLMVGIFQQHQNETDCMDFTSVCEENISEESLLKNEDELFQPEIHPICDRIGQIMITRIHSDDAKGPTWARHHVEKFGNDEEYYLQVDSHSVFVQNWDTIAISMFLSLENDFAVLTTYPDDVSNRHPNDEQDNIVCAICVTGFEHSNHGMIKHHPAQCNILSKERVKKPILTPFWGAGLSFSKAHRISNVPYDEYTPMLFDGEEFSMTTRMWTSGYDFYVPIYDIVYHKYWENDERPRFLDEDAEYRFHVMKKSAERVKYQLGLEYDSDIAILTDADKYQMGKKRSLKSYLEFAGINLVEKTTKNLCNQIFNNELSFVPWD